MLGLSWWIVRGRFDELALLLARVRNDSTAAYILPTYRGIALEPIQPIRPVRPVLIVLGCAAISDWCCSPAELLSPPTKLPANCQKTWVIYAGEFGHVHVVAADPNRNVPRQNRRVLRHNLPSIVNEMRAIEPCHHTHLADAWQRQLLEEAADFDRLSLFAARQDHGVETVLDPREYLRVALEHLDNLCVGLLDDPDGSRQPFGPSCQPRSMVWRPEKDNAVCQPENVVEVWFRRPLSRYDQCLSRE